MLQIGKTRAQFKLIRFELFAFAKSCMRFCEINNYFNKDELLLASNSYGAFHFFNVVKKVYIWFGEQQASLRDDLEQSQPQHLFLQLVVFILVVRDIIKNCAATNEELSDYSLRNSQSDTTWKLKQNEVRKLTLKFFF